jgi:AGZA family xanthine/uracil permease-like MFS transporter
MEDFLMDFIKSFFKLEERGTTVQTEFLAGLTTFLAMAYILFVNPNTLTATITLDDDTILTTGLEWGAIFTATAIAAIAGTLIMGLYANYPVALAPGMGMNAFFTYTVIFTLGYSAWQGFAGIVISGVLFLLLSISGLRKRIINAIPKNLKLAIGAGIGFFIAFIGLQNAGLIVDNPATLVGLGELSDPVVLLSVFGLFVTIVLFVLKIRGAILYGIVITSIVGMIFGLVGLPTGLVSAPPAPYFFEFTRGFTEGTWDFQFFIVIFALLFIDFFDTAGTLVTVGNRAGLLDEAGELKDNGKALLADSSATIIGAVAGTSSTTSYIESLAGVEVGGRTGLTSVFTALFFLVFMFFSPLLSVVTAAVTAPALIMVGVLMATQLKDIDWDDSVVAFVAFLVILVMPLTYSIAEGIAVGFLFYPLLMLITNRKDKVSVEMWVLSGIFLVYFIIKALTDL